MGILIQIYRNTMYTYSITLELAIMGKHGYYATEQVLGKEFTIHCLVEWQEKELLLEDSISTTINYEKLHAILVEEFSVPEKLLETVSSKIYQRIESTFPNLNSIHISIEKPNPIMQYVKKAIVTLKNN